MLLLNDQVQVASGPHNGNEWKSLPKGAAAIYALVNEANGKIYVGRSVDVRDRLRTHYKKDFERYNGQKLTNAKKKYGLESFKFYIIEWTEKDLVLEREDFYLKMLSPFDTNGYNIRNATDSHNGSFVMSVEQKNKISESLKAYHEDNDNAFKGKSHSSESKELIKQNLRDENGVLKSAKTMQSDEYRKMKSEHAKDNNIIERAQRWIEENGSPHRTAVVMLDPLTKEPIREFETVKEAAVFLGKKRGTSISNCLSGRSTKAYGYCWLKK